MNVDSPHFDSRKQQFREAWPGFRGFWPGLPIGLVVGLALFVLLPAEVAESVAIAVALFFLFSTFGLVQAFYELPGLRQHWGVAVLSVLVGAALAVFVTMVVGYTVAFGVDWGMGVLGFGS